MSFSPLGSPAGAAAAAAHFDGVASSAATARALPNFADSSFAGKKLAASTDSFDARPQQVYVHRINVERRGSMPQPHAALAASTSTTEARRASLGPGIALLPRSVLFSPSLARRDVLQNSTTHVVLTRSDLALTLPSEDVEERSLDGEDDVVVEGQFDDADEVEDALPESPTLPASTSRSPLLSPKTSSLLTPRSPESATLDAQLQSASLALEELRESVKDRPRPRSVLLSSSSSRPGSMMIKAHRRFSEVTSRSDAAVTTAASDDAAFAQWKAAFAARHFGANANAAAVEPADAISPLQLAPSPAARDATVELGSEVPVDSPITRGRRRRRDENRLDAQTGSSSLSNELHLRSISAGSSAADVGHGSPVGLGLGIFVEERSEQVDDEEPEEVWHEAREVIDDEGSSVKLNSVELPPPVGKLHQIRDLIHEPGHAADVAVLPQGKSPTLPKLRMRPQPRSLLAAQAAVQSPGAARLVPRHWYLTASGSNSPKPSSAPATPSAAAKKDGGSSSSSNPCPPTTTANKSWTSALANNSSAWASPKANGSPAMPNSATSTPLMAQTPTMASLPASPMMPQATDVPVAEQQPDTGAQHAATPGQNAQGGEHHAADSHLSTATMVAASAAGAVLLIFAFIWAILARKRRNKRRRHLSGVLRKFGDQGEKGERNASVTSLGGDWVAVPEARALPSDGVDQARRSSSLDKSNGAGAGIDNVSYFHAQQQQAGVRDDELTVINSWLPVEGGGARGTRISTDLARSGIVSASPSKDASFTWQHPTLSLPPAAARALATSHYVKKRATMPAKGAASATDLASSASSPGLPVRRQESSLGGAAGDDSFCTSLGEALSSSNCLADTLHASSGASSTSDDTAPAAVANRLLAHAYSASVSTSSASGAERSSPWLSTILKSVPRPVASTPPRGGMSRFSLTMRTPQSLPSIASRDAASTGSPSAASSGNSTEAGEIRFVTKTANHARRTLDVGASQSSPRGSRTLMKGRTRSSTLSRLSFVQLPEPVRSVSVELPQAVKISAPLVVISRPTETPPVVSSSLNKRMSLWRTSLSTCREDSRDSLANAVSTPSTTTPVPAHLVTQSAPLQQGTFGRAWALQPRSEFDSSEDELRQGYEAGEETDADTVFATRYLSQSPGSPASSYVPSTSGGHSSAATSMPPTPTKSSANSSLNGVHKRAPRLPPMPLITLTLDDGLVQRPLSLTSDSSSDSEHSADEARDRRMSGRVNARPASAVTTARLALQNAGGGFDEDEDDAESFIGMAMTSGGEVHASSGRMSRAGTRRVEVDEDDGYGSDSIEGCLEFDDFPTMPRIIAAAGGRRPSY